MSLEEKKPVAEEGGGESAPLWIISFADMISLLMAFFVMLSTFNSFDAEEKEKLDATIAVVLMECGGWASIMSGGDMASGASNEHDGGAGPGAEAPDQPKKASKTEPMYNNRFYTDRVFLVPTKFLFHSSGAALTTDGRKWLDDLSMYLSKMPGQVLIAEQRRPDSKWANPQRAIAVVEYLAGRDIESGRISVSSQVTSADAAAQHGEALEISLLEKGVCP